MRRRDFVTVVAGGAALTWPLIARAQQPKRIGVVMAYAESDLNGQLQVAALRQQLEKLGWMEGRNIQIDLRYAADDQTRIRGRNPDFRMLGHIFVTRPPALAFQSGQMVTSLRFKETASGGFKLPRKIPKIGSA